MRVAAFTIILFLLVGGLSFANTHTAADCEYGTINTLIADAGVTTGDIVAVPAGDCTWTVTNYVNVNKSITLKGAGIGVTNITVSDTSYGGGAVRVSAASATVKDFTFLQPDNDTGYIISVSGASFRITGNTFTTAAAHHHINTIFISGVYGVIDNNLFEKQAGDAEFIFIQGPTNSWATDHSIGGADNVFVENNTVTDGGYPDCHKNARCVFRYNTITGDTKIDAHGKCSNTGDPIRGVRHWEIYNNLWTLTTSNMKAIEVRGGTGRIFNNVSQATSATYGMYLTDYSTFQTCPGVFDGCRCPADYPIDDQIGVGKDPKSGASEPVYVWGNIRNSTNWTIRDQTWNIPGACAECGYTDFQPVIQSDRDYFISVTKPAAISTYEPFDCPHTLVGAGTCDPDVAGRDGYALGEAPAAGSTTFSGTGSTTMSGTGSTTFQ